LDFLRLTNYFNHYRNQKKIAFRTGVIRLLMEIRQQWQDEILAIRRT
tara:strand:+ start:54188 stop:54328 length:141 start_codon:yes stop_codon:yes gene_type:complete